MQTRAADEPSTRRILAASRERVARGGVAGISMGDVAARAGVSKALVLYHFHDKESLLLALVEDVGRGVVSREESVVTGSSAPHALDDYWGWLERELALGEIRILVALSESESERVRAASRRIARDRLSVAGRHIASVFARLALTPRIPAPLLAETVVAFVDGLAVAKALTPDRDVRPAFDALWLALLTLAE